MMGKNTKIVLISIVAIIIIAANNIFFYNILSDTLKIKQKQNVDSIANHIKTSIEQSRKGSNLFENMIGQKLRSDSIAVQYALPSKLKDVKLEHLIKMKNQLNLQHISLMKKTAEDIIVDKSTDPTQLGMSTNTWGLWYDAFEQLFHSKDASITWGQKLTHYWSGPYEIAASDTKTIYKWGYYYDGTTDYMIDPYVADKEYKEYQRTTGTDAIISTTLNSYPALLEITGINPATFGKEYKFNTPKGELETLVHRPYFFGSYTYNNVDKDTEFITRAIQTNSSISYEANLNGKLVEKTFIPIQTTMLQEALGYEAGNGENIDLQSYVLCLVSDKKLITQYLTSQFRTLITIIFIVSLLSVILLIIMLRLIGKARDKAVQKTSQTYTEEVNQMFLNIKGQRHDFLNHVNVIHSFVELGKYEELKKYTNTLIGEIGTVNDVIKIGQPEIAAIVQAKMVMADNKKIQFLHEFESLDSTMTGTKSMDVVRIIGNLMDNAFDEIEEMPTENRWVKCSVWLENKQLNFYIENPLTRSLTEDDKVDLFKTGYSTKEGDRGYGLSITKSLISKCRGDLQINASDSKIRFHVSIPIN
jgi:signal transduction histidine kinase